MKYFKENLLIFWDDIRGFDWGLVPFYIIYGVFILAFLATVATALLN